MKLLAEFVDRIEESFLADRIEYMVKECDDLLRSIPLTEENIADSITKAETSVVKLHDSIKKVRTALQSTSQMVNANRMSKDKARNIRKQLITKMSTNLNDTANLLTSFKQTIDGYLGNRPSESQPEQPAQKQGPITMFKATMDKHGGGRVQQLMTAISDGRPLAPNKENQEIVKSLIASRHLKDGNPPTITSKGTAILSKLGSPEGKTQRGNVPSLQDIVN